MTKATPEQVVDAYFDALAARDFQRLRSYLADEGFTYRSPISCFEHANDFVDDVSRIGPILEGIEHRRTFVDGDEVCRIVNFKTRMDSLQVTPVVHWSKVQNGKIVAIETFFDAREYARLFEVD